MPHISSFNTLRPLSLGMLITLSGCSALFGPAPDPAADAYCAEKARLMKEDNATPPKEGQCQRDLYKIRDSSPAVYACFVQCPDKGSDSAKQFNKCGTDCRTFRGAPSIQTSAEATVQGSGARIDVLTIAGASVTASINKQDAPQEAVADAEGRASFTFDDLDPKYHRITVKTDKDGVPGQDVATFTIQKQSFRMRARKANEGDFLAPCTLEVQSKKIGSRPRKSTTKIPFGDDGQSTISVSWTGMDALYFGGAQQPVRNDFVEIAIKRSDLLWDMPAAQMMQGQRSSTEVVVSHQEEGRLEGELSCGLGALTYESGQPYNVLDEPADRMGSGQVIVIKQSGPSDTWTFDRSLDNNAFARNVDYFLELDLETESLGVTCPYKDEATGKVSDVALSKQHALLSLRNRRTGEEVADTKLLGQEPRCPETISSNKSSLVGGVTHERVDAWVASVLPATP